VFEEKTVIAIAHRLSTIQHSDEILVLAGGKIIERGTHITLLAQSGFYANLVEEVDRD
jgi:ATP-binding cassette subfamily B multidrug efflux pump